MLSRIECYRQFGSFDSKQENHITVISGLLISSNLIWGSSNLHEFIAEIMVYCRQEVVMLKNEVVFNEAIIEEREQGILEIQQQIGEVNDIFKDLAVLVQEQGVMIG